MLPGANHARLMAKSGYDWLCIDTEHGNIAGIFDRKVGHMRCAKMKKTGRCMKLLVRLRAWVLVRLSGLLRMKDGWLRVCIYITFRDYTSFLFDMHL